MLHWGEIRSVTAALACNLPEQAGGCRKQILLSGLYWKKSLIKPWLPVLFFSFKILLSMPNSYVDKCSQNKPEKEKLTLTYKFKLLNWPVRGLNKQTENPYHSPTKQPHKKYDKTGTCKCQHKLKWGINLNKPENWTKMQHNYCIYDDVMQQPRLLKTYWILWNILNSVFQKKKKNNKTKRNLKKKPHSLQVSLELAVTSC